MAIRIEVLKLRQEDVSEITTYLGDARDHVLGDLHSRGFDPHIASTGDGRKIPIDEYDVPEIKLIRDVERTRRRMLSESEGHQLWAILEEVYGPRRMEHRMFWEDFGELAPLAKFTMTARIRGERRCSRDRAMRIMSLAQQSRPSGPLRPGFVAWPSESAYPTSRLSLVERVIRLDEQTAREPSPEDVTRATVGVLEVATRATPTGERVDQEFVDLVDGEILEMHGRAGHAYRFAKRALGLEDASALAEAEDRDYPELEGLLAGALT